MIGKRQRASAATPIRKRRKDEPRIEEISFDPLAREDWLGGFHKRKLERIKHAQEAAAKREREEKIRGRNQLRQERRAELSEHVEAMNRAMEEVNGGGTEADRRSDSEASQVAVEEGVGTNGTPPPEPTDHEDEYVDEEKYTTVTVEEVNVSKHGMHRVGGDADDEEGQHRRSDGTVDELHGDTGHDVEAADNSKKKRIWTKENPNTKKKKKKFRYESQAERKMNRAKERAKKKARATSRRGE